MTTATLRVGLIGVGSMGRNHARVLAGLEGTDLVAVADPVGDPNAVAKGAAVFTSVDSLLSRSLDYCVVAAPTQFHYEIAMRLADAGVSMLIEKPLSRTAAEAEKIAAVFESARLVGAVGHIERYNPALRQLKSRLRSGEIGDIYQVATRRQGPFPARIGDVGVVMDLATHDLDLTAFITEQHYRTVSAQLAHKSGRESEDLVAIVGSMNNGLLTNHLVNWLSPMKERLTIVTGENGTFVADTLTGDLTLHRNGTEINQWSEIAHFRGMTEGDMIRFAIPKAEPLVTEHEEFRNAVLGLPAETVSLRQGLETVIVAEAVLQSGRTRQIVALPEEDQVG